VIIRGRRDPFVHPKLKYYNERRSSAPKKRFLGGSRKKGDFSKVSQSHQDRKRFTALRIKKAFFLEEDGSTKIPWERRRARSFTEKK